MSRIEITVGNATVEVSATAEHTTGSGMTFPVYNPVELLDATVAALLAINTLQSVSWAGDISRMTARQ